MELLVLLGVFIIFDLLAWRFGYDSRDDLRAEDYDSSPPRSSRIRTTVRQRRGA